MMFGSIISHRTPVPKFGYKFWKRFTNYPWLQNTFTNRPETHCSIYVGDLHRLNKQMIFEAAIDVHYTDWNFNPTIHTVFQIGATERELAQVLESVIKDYNGKLYGFAQILYFIPRWIFGKIFDVRRWWFPFRGGIICSELVWHYLHRIAKLKKWYDLKEYLEQWNPNNFHSGDCRDVLDKFTGVHFIKLKGI